MKHIFLLALLLMSGLGFAQVKIGDNPTTIGASSLLELESTNKALLITRVANTAAVTSPVDGMVIYDISSQCMRAYQNGNWSPCMVDNGPIVPCATPTTLTVPAATSISTGNALNTTATGGDPGVISWAITPTTGVSTATGYGLSTGDITFASAGTYTLTYTSTNNNAPASCFPTTTATATRTINVAAVSVTNGLGSGTFGGRTCFDVAASNNNVAGCGDLNTRTNGQDDFSNGGSLTYTYTPSGTVSNVRFVYVNTGGNVISSIDGGNPGNNISTPVKAKVNFNTDLNSLAAGLTSANPLTAEIYVIYNDGATGGGTDKQIKLTINVKDCECCEVKTSLTEYREFMCHNLGADLTARPHFPIFEIQGAQIQWGRRGPTGDWATAPSNGALGFTRAPTTTNYDELAVSGWNTTPVSSNNAWNSGTETNPVKTANDPCPAGYRVPTISEWKAVIDNNLYISYGNFVSSSSNASSILNFVSNDNQSLLSLPLTGSRNNFDGRTQSRGALGWYWSSTRSTGNDGDFLRVMNIGPTLRENYSVTGNGMSVRCIREN